MKDSSDFLTGENENKQAPEVEDLISEMTIEEKVAQLGSVMPEKIIEDGEFSQEKAENVIGEGIGQITRPGGGTDFDPAETADFVNEIQEFLEEETRLGIPAIMHEECLSGYMGAGGTTYPQAIGLAGTWDPNLIERITGEVRKQLKAIGAHHALSPVLDVARDLRWGRVEETFGEDPYFVAKMTSSYIEGLQGQDHRNGIFATVKHFGGHSVCEGGRNHAPVNLSERELRENFLFPFEVAVRKVGAKAVMNAYHDLDGVPCVASRKLLTDILRNEWGFDGIVVSDYWSIGMLKTDHFVAPDGKEAAIKSLEAGMDVELPERECFDENLAEAVRNGQISESVLDRAVRRHLKAKMEKGAFDENRYAEGDTEEVFETEEQRKLARKAARKSVVLLKNEGELLPLDNDIGSIAVLGPNADEEKNLLGDYAYDVHVEKEERTISVKTILEGIRDKVSENTEINYSKGCTIRGNSKEGFDEAVEAARNSDVAVLVVGGKSGLGLSDPDERKKESAQTTGEGNDRTDLELPGVQKDLVKEIHDTDVPLVVILINGRPLATRWISENVPALLEAWLPGEEGGNGVAEVLFGEYNPGGRLPVSIPKNVGQLPVHYNRKPISADRSYVFENSKPLYPFGYGKSYTKFEYGSLEIRPSEIRPASDFSVGAEVKNVGERRGDEVVQLYVRDKISSLTRPVKQLKGFKRIGLKAGEKKKVDFTLSADQLAFYDENMDLVVEPGKFEIMIGRSSEDIELEGELKVKGDKKVVPDSRRYITDVEVK